MKKNIGVKLTILLYIIFTVTTIALMFIIYRDIDNPYAIKFVIGYVIFLIAFVLYLITVTIINMRKLTWPDVRKRLRNFILWFAALWTISFISRYAFNRPSKGVFGDIAIPLGLAMGFAFLDIVFASSKNK